MTVREGHVDERDLEILEVLEADARIPWRQLAQKLGVSEATVYLRVRKLQELGVIKGYTVKLDMDRLGIKARAIVRIKTVPGMAGRVVESLLDRPQVIEAYEVTGSHNLIAFLAAPSLEEAAKAIDEISSLEGVSDVETIFVLRVVKERQGVVRIAKLAKRE
ncbi:MAG: Lrp/AsnC family transcriptional regulator [Desulfurococcales archaeon]|nr:Lrp/AsnC family transcriptional regulator [Desulfurococcales archaeon]